MHRLQLLLLEGRVQRPSRLHAERGRRRGVPPRLASRGVHPGRQRRPGRARRGRRPRRHGVRDRAGEAGLRSGAPRRGRSRDRRDRPLDPEASRAWRVGPAPRLANGPAAAAAQERGDRHRRHDRSRRCSRLRSRARGRRDGFGVGRRRPERLLVRADPGRRRRPALGAHTGADHARGQATPWPACGRVRLRGVLHGRRARRAAPRGRPPGRAGHTARAGRARLPGDSRATPDAPAAARDRGAR